MRKFYLYIFFSFIAFTYCHAQNNTSPYSMMGIGDIESSYFDRTTGMANTGVALSSYRFMYNMNPASYSLLNDHLLHFELSTRYKGVLYSGRAITANDKNSSSADIQIKKISLAIKLKPKWGFSFGLMPFSNSNYSFSSTKPVVGTSYNVPAYYDGSGNINQVYITNSFKLSNKLSMGIQSSFVFGQQQQQETVYSGIIDSTLVTTNNTYYSNLYFKGGFQYKTKVNSKWNIAVGATGSLKTKLNAQTTVESQMGNSTLPNSNTYPSTFFRLPFMFTAGLAATFKDKLTYVADYSHQSWDKLNYSGVGYNLTSSSRYSAGFEYSKKVRYRDYIIEKYFIQAGVYYTNSYLTINGQQINDAGFSLGYGKTLTNNGLGIQTALQLGTRGTTNNGLIKENYMQLTFTLSFGELLYSKVRYN